MSKQGLRFKKSSRSEATDHCVELAHDGPGAAIRDSKAPSGQMLQLRGATLPWLISESKSGTLDLRH